jgi:hypothetical protein
VVKAAETRGAMLRAPLTQGTQKLAARDPLAS